jgi:hypothetical protein
VLVTNLNPLSIWMFDTPYLRFGAEDYNKNDISNKFAHLTNNSIVKYSKQFVNDKIEGNMWYIQQFQKYLYVSYIVYNYLGTIWKGCMVRVKRKNKKYNNN